MHSNSHQQSCSDIYGDLSEHFEVQIGNFLHTPSVKSIVKKDNSEIDLFIGLFNWWMN